MWRGAVGGLAHTAHVDDQRSELRELLEGLTPAGAPMRMTTPFAVDEAAWFVRAVDAEIVRFRDCPPDCFRFRKYGILGPDHFETPAGNPRHLFSKPGDVEAWLNREYVPHVGAFGFAILTGGFDLARCSFSLYRKFARDLITKRAGQSYETDAEFYGSDGAIRLQIEAKASPLQTEGLAAAIRQHCELQGLPGNVVKEIEYVLDLKPEFLWVVGPDALDPARHVYAVEVSGKNAKFTPVPGLPTPPA